MMIETFSILMTWIFLCSLSIGLRLRSSVRNSMTIKTVKVDN